MARPKQLMRFGVHDTQNCCGLQEVGGFYFSAMEDYGNNDAMFTERYVDGDMAFFATTASNQRAVVKRLKKLGFKHIKTWRRKHGVKLKLWFRTPKPEKRKRVRTG